MPFDSVIESNESNNNSNNNNGKISSPMREKMQKDINNSGSGTNNGHTRQAYKPSGRCVLCNWNRWFGFNWNYYE